MEKLRKYIILVTNGRKVPYQIFYNHNSKFKA